jgi:hypothetical protein
VQQHEVDVGGLKVLQGLVENLQGGAMAIDGSECVCVQHRVSWQVVVVFVCLFGGGGEGLADCCQQKMERRQPGSEGMAAWGGMARRQENGTASMDWSTLTNQAKCNHSMPGSESLSHFRREGLTSSVLQ